MTITRSSPLPASLCAQPVLRRTCLFLSLTLVFWGMGHQVALADPVTDYNVAVEFYQQRRWDMAADACADFLKKTPKHELAPTVRLYLAQSLLHLRKFREAREQFQIFLKQANDHTDRPLAMYRVGECSYFLGDYQAAKTQLAEFVKAYPKNALCEWALVYLGESELRLNQNEAALQTFQDAVNRFPKGRMLDDAEFGLATALERLDRFDQAQSILERIVARLDSTRAADAQFHLAARLFEDQKYEQAAAMFQAIPEKFPKHRLVPGAQLNAGYSLYYLARYPEAIENFQKAATDPAQAQTAAYWIGLSLKSQGEYEQAAKTFAEALEASPDSPLADKLTFHQGDAEFRLSDFDRAIELFRSVPEKWPQSELADDALHSACEAALQSDQLKLAQQLSQQFATQFPQSGLAQVQELLRGRILIAQGDQAGADTEAGKKAYEQARTILQQVADSSKVDQTREFARFQLARVAERQGRDADVITEVQQILSSPNAAESAEFVDALLLLANAQLRLKQAQEALSTYEKALAVAQSSDQRLRITAGLVSALSQLKDWDRVRSMLAELSKLDSQNETFGAVALAAGDAAFEDKNWKAAAGIFQLILDRSGENSFALPALSGLAHTEYEEKEFETAAQSFASLAEQANGDPVLSSHARFMQGLALQQADNLKQALETFQKAAQTYSQLDSDSPLKGEQIEVGMNAYRCAKGGARVARELEDRAAADKLYEAAYRELKSQPPEQQKELDLLINEWADLRYNAEEYERADELYRLLIQERPESSLADDARLILAESLRFGGKPGEAVDAFRQLSQDPRSDDFVRQRAYIHLLDLLADEGQWPEVLATSEQVLTRFPESDQKSYILYRRGEALVHEKKYADAIIVLKKLTEELAANLKQAPSWWPEAWLLLAEAEFWQKDYAAMEKTLADLKKKAPDSPVLYRADAILGRGLENQARFEDARKAYSRVIDSPSGKGTETAAEAQFRIAESYLKENNLPVALREYYKVYAGYDAPKYEAAALYQAASCDVSMKHFPEAAETYRKLMTEFPESEFAVKAQERLKELEASSAK